MGNKSSIEIVIRTDKNFYYPGETVNSTIYLNCPKPIPCSKLVVQIIGFQECEFRLPADNSKIQRGRNNLIQTFFILKDFYNLKSFLHGQYEFPFTFTLPFFLPGSFHQQKGAYKAKIFYSIKTIIVGHKQQSTSLQKQQQIIVRQVPKEVDQHQYGQILIYPKCLWRNLGACKVSCYFQRKNYLPGDQCIMICQVDNFKSKANINRIKCQFVKITSLRAHNGIQKTISQTINTVQFKGVSKSQGYFGELAQRLMLPLKYKNTTNSIHPSTTGNMVKCEYFINVKPQIGGCCTKGSKNFAVKLQILAPEIIQSLQKPEQWTPQVEIKSNIYLNYKDEDEMRDSILQ